MIVVAKIILEQDVGPPVVIDAVFNVSVEFAIPHLLEVSIGHALTVDAMRFGFAESVKRYIEALAARVSE